MANDFSQMNDELEDLVAQLAQEFMEEMELGRVPDIEAYAQRQPAASVEIREALSALYAMREAPLPSPALESELSLISVKEKLRASEPANTESAAGSLDRLFESVDSKRTDRSAQFEDIDSWFEGWDDLRLVIRQ